VPRYARILDAGPQAFLGHGIAVANAASFDFDAHLSGTGLGNFPFDDLKRFVCPAHLRHTHFRHNPSELY
jgi:hypothetical protein